MIVVQNTDKSCMEIHLDAHGIRLLKRLLDQLTSAGANEHVHLMTPDWGGNELDNEPQSEGAEIVNKLDIYLWKDPEPGPG